MQPLQDVHLPTRCRVVHEIYLRSTKQSSVVLMEPLEHIKWPSATARRTPKLAQPSLRFSYSHRSTWRAAAPFIAAAVHPSSRFLCNHRTTWSCQFFAARSMVSREQPSSRCLCSHSTRWPSVRVPCSHLTTSVAELGGAGHGVVCRSLPPGFRLTPARYRSARTPRP